MPFQLTISKGRDAGKSFVFSVAEVRIGRTSDNDIVLRDEGVSRRHARLLDDGHRCFLEDLGSANGTRVNGSPLVSTRRELLPGDRFSVGPVLFVFERPTPAALVALEETRLISAHQPGEKLRLGGTFAEDELADFESEPTTLGLSGRARGRAPRPGERVLDDDTSPAAPKTPEPSPSAPRGRFAELLPEVGSSVASAARVAQVDTRLNPTADAPTGETGLPPPPVRRPANDLSDDPTSDGGFVPPSVSVPRLSAAERARIRRASGDTLASQLRIFWAELPSGGRRLLVTGVLLALVTVAGTLAYVFAPELEGLKPRGPEPELLTRKTLEDSFGLGPGVTWQRPDMKIFRFVFVSPTRAVAVLHLQAKDIAADEVSVFLNGADLGMLPADVADSQERNLEIVLPPRHLRREGENQLVLDNLKNPPGSDTWRVQKLWVEIIPVPELSPEETRRKAEELASQGRELYERRDIGADNLFNAWKAYRYAWLSLEALEQKPELHLFVRDSLQRITRELDQQCARLLLEVHRSQLFKNRKKAHATLKEALRYFPTNEHWCHAEAEARMAELPP